MYRVLFALTAAMVCATPAEAATKPPTQKERDEAVRRCEWYYRRMHCYLDSAQEQAEAVRNRALKEIAIAAMEGCVTGLAGKTVASVCICTTISVGIKAAREIPKACAAYKKWQEYLENALYWADKAESIERWLWTNGERGHPLGDDVDEPDEIDDD